MAIILNGSTGVATPAVTDASGGNTSTINGVVVAVDNYIGMRNRIINGDMRIDQRNVGASVTANDGYITVDRWKFNSTQNGKGTIQRSTVAPPGFTNSLLFTSTSAYSVLSSDLIDIQCRLEGFNMADLGWGTAGAQAVTLSFWVRSSLTGTFGGAVRSGGGSARSYPFSYTINSANTWEQKTITVPGDTSGTWATDNTQWGSIQFGLGDGSTYSGTAGVWASATYTNSTGATSVVGTNGATFYITGVQLEVGSVATPFERRPYGTELMLCQRYFYKWESGIDNNILCVAQAYASTAVIGKFLDFPVSMRVAPSVTWSSASDWAAWNSSGSGTAAFSNTPSGFQASKNSLGTASGWGGTSGLTAGNAVSIRANINASISMSSEL